MADDTKIARVLRISNLNILAGIVALIGILGFVLVYVGWKARNCFFISAEFDANKQINRTKNSWLLLVPRYFSHQFLACYLGVIRHGVFSFCNLSRYIPESALIQLFSHLAFRRNHQTHFATGSFAQEKARTQQNGLILVALKN
ncbi:hypothetical protein [Alteromonas mediterranea]|uniref:Uncharacterized protein n=1 Tax=Alteromonas mediterranea TaxID=314275 RepID=A0AAC9AD59_9ALTE|nr:hypothetical protein [Alteromonas mediterranea]AGP96120.1 hypothetical protein I635_02875 [Alteromonas mediterranea UM7]AGQ00453.1 hypothetical protein I636_02895 [Alteromonas mediterranea UM4b]AMJ77320.1 hypothetical protein AV942_02820 [Alteromonas mediterranea]AMJ81454.1 hypothetical protein AV941_02775 [Alteromonas mediterranea]HBL22047.1 hypothetical protein [Alteromonas mediterranea]|tara:strand:+ start:3637 stop:4068 length:432 start_codon:yes stop_codon:yes gene_type:complete